MITPDPEVLERAASSLATILGETARPITWDIGARRDLTRSTVFPLVAMGDGVVGSAYYKQASAPSPPSAKDRIWEAELETGMRNAVTMEACLETVLPDEIRIARTLAADPARLISVTLEVDGVELGRLWRRALTGGRRAAAHSALGLVGLASRVFESCSPLVQSLDPRLTGEDVVDRRIERMRGVLPEGLTNSLAARLDNLERATRAEPYPYVLAHGDLNTSNILLREGGGVGIIDFGWLPRLRGYDMTHLAFRLQYDRVAPPALARSLVSAMLDGYGDQELPSSATWRFLRASKLMRLIDRSVKGRVRGRRRVARARRELEQLLQAV